MDKVKGFSRSFFLFLLRLGISPNTLIHTNENFSFCNDFIAIPRQFIRFYNLTPQVTVFKTTYIRFNSRLNVKLIYTLYPEINLILHNALPVKT